MSAIGGIVLQNSKKALWPISRQRTKTATIVDQQGFKHADRIACAFKAW
jgi:hypothetical protein